jgi:hypothetical protein
MGLNRPAEWDKHPRLKLLYEDYLLCRTQDLKIFEKAVDGGSKKDQKKKLMIVPWTTGFAQLPSAGGIDDQDYQRMRIFSEFLRGDRQGSMRLMNS